MGDIAPVDLTSTDYARMADPVNIYKEPPLGTTDAWDFAIAEPFGANRRGALDRRHPTVVRPSTRMR